MSRLLNVCNRSQTAIGQHGFVASYQRPTLNLCLLQQSCRKYSCMKPRNITQFTLAKKPCILTMLRWASSSTRNAVSRIKLEKPKSSDVSRLFSLAKPERYRLMGSIVLLVISSGVTLAVPYAIGRIINMLYTEGKSDDHEEMLKRLKYISKIMLAVFIVGAAANAGRFYLMQTAGQRVVRKMRENLYSSILRQEMAFFDKTRTGELVNRLSTDTTLVGQSVTMNISDGLRSMAQAIGAVSMMFYVSPKLAGVALAIVPSIAAASIIYGRYVKKITRQVQDSLAESTQVAEERLSGMRTVRAFVKEISEMDRYKDKIDHVLKLSYKEAIASGIFWGSTGLSGNIVILSVFYYGGIMMSESQLTVGDLTSFLLYAAYSGISLAGMTSFYSNMMKGLGASSRIWELSDRLPAIPLEGGFVPQTEFQGSIELKDVSFTYPARSDIPIFNSLNLQIPQGKVLAIVGPSGSGKSTIASLLLRYYDPTQGSILVDGYDLKELSTAWVRSHMGVVSQEPLLFSCSIRDNIVYGAVDPLAVTEQEIMNAAQMANALDFIQEFPKGFGTLVGERGVMLSGGQKQRIAIARAIIKNPKILLLDEATSALDAVSEHLVQEALDRVMVGRTSITIAHRLSTIRKADTIAVLDGGCVTESGSYSELMALPDGTFRQLVERQTIQS